MADLSAWIEKNKALWTRVYEEVLAPDFEAEWKKREEVHEKELKQRDKNHSTDISNEHVKTAHLLAENEQLKRQAQEQYQGMASTSGQEIATARESMVSEEELRQLTDKYNELSRKYQNISQKVKYLERKNNAVMQKNKDMKESVRAWQEYADRQSGKQKLKSETRAGGGQAKPSAIHISQDDRPHVPSSPGSVATTRTPRSLADTDRSSPAPMLPLPQASRESTSLLVSPRLNMGNDERSSSASSTPKPQDPVTPIEQQCLDINDLGHVLPSDTRITALIDERSAQTYNFPTNPSSSQTTEDESVESTKKHTQVLDAEDDDDIPQFVSARSLKRKRGEPSKSKFEIFADRSADGTPAKPFRVKEEHLSSPPTTIYKLMRKETIDLDDPTPKVLQTPRHPRRKLSVDSNRTSTLLQHRSNSTSFIQDIKQERPEAGHLTTTDAVDLNAGVNMTQVALAEVRAISEPAKPTQTEKAVLQSLDPNILGNTSEEPPNKRLREAEVRRNKGYGILAESGEESPPVDENELRLPPHLARTQFNRRLNALGNPQTPAKGLHQTLKPASTRIKLEQVLTPPSSTSRSRHMSSERKGSRTNPSKARSKPRDDPILDDRPIWTMKTPDTRSSTRKDRTSPTKQNRLRDMPITKLNVQDFKPNPAYNQGYSYAFSETVRKRGDRMCLPGCTNPQCCGSTFRILAEAHAPLPASQEEALLEDYLGDAYNNMQLTQMSSEERKELVLQARTKKMAKETGKHREAYERRRTPPGFWRVDFPTTQEQQEDRERSKLQEQKLVQERWLEAHRKGGKWIFKDE
ncbi:SAE2-domain-containing protein [Cucurbitaria berberidis CBS 394.84]|uniref:SAE2-domain-containing protein n=1 Tax=Cucurbitaria berberidis CBS 394.84 TaxID=1168544 RepID=A0A9P4GEH7_9PLEO|nr:SAE2-domain-containing protein [Cucurbitaria berberidis CBS 394.84]KAF1844528.1 SAE2-domain-containing protein [Cucurbitaria berberidis CBS 394.84]